ncbi:MAG: 6-phosphofructokinase [Chloroflexi bacterium]|nr:6-phosphofructokinase [Chloroflexota bacterium]
MSGTLVVGQSGGSTATLSNTLAGVLAAALQSDAVDTVYGMCNGIEGLLHEQFVDLTNAPARLLDALRQTPSAALGSCRYGLTESDAERVLEVLKAHDVRYFIYIGGNGSALTVQAVNRWAQASSYDLNAIAVPKTIDNDLWGTDHTPGYGSAARFAALAALDGGADSWALRTHDHVKILETFGRNTGWVTAATALAKREEADPPHLIFVPERPLTQERFLQEVQAAYDRFGYVHVAVCEGLRRPDGELLFASDRAVDRDVFGRGQLGGVSTLLAELVANELGLKSRTDKPGTMQRACMSLASSVDLEESYRVGKAGVTAAASGATAKMITLEREPGPEYAVTTSLIAVDDVAGKERPLPEAYLNEAGNYVTTAFLDYVRPLIGAPLPEYVRLGTPTVSKQA